MKKLLVFLAAICAAALALASCGKDVIDKIPETHVTDEDYEGIKKLFEDNGCKYDDTDYPLKMLKFDTLGDNKYAYGSREEGGKESFWAAKFSKSGELLWEKFIQNGVYSSHAIFPKVLSNGDLVVGNVLKSDQFNMISCNPVILNSQNGNPTRVDVADNYFFTDLYVFEGWFICDISEIELSKLANGAVKWSAQISNEGKILNQNEDLRIPQRIDDLYAFSWYDCNSYVYVGSKSIQRVELNTDRSEKDWSFDFQNVGNVNDFHISFTDDLVVIGYTSDINKERETISLLFETGERQGIWFIDASLSLLIGESKLVEIKHVGLKDKNVNVKYASSNPRIASITDDGLIKAVSRGTATITAITEDGIYKDECTVEVLHFTDRITIGKSGSVMNVGGFVTAVLDLSLNNKSGKRILVKELKVIDGYGKEYLSTAIDDYLPNEQSFVNSISISQVYKPTYKYIYQVDGKDYEAILTE